MSPSSSTWYPFNLTHSLSELRLGMFTAAQREAHGGVNPSIDALWNIFDHLATVIDSDAAILHSLGRPHLAESAVIHASVVVDTTHGPVIIDHGARVEPFVYIRGPVAIGKNSLVRAGTRLYGPVVIGPVCKVGGELEDCVIHEYSNKQHDGFLGHSWIGSWCNLGAGTTTSDLKNTYGTIELQLPEGTVPTGRRFLGSLLGDHTRTAIGTQLLTGTVTGAFVNVMAPGFPPRHVPSCTWDVTTGEPYGQDKAIDVARRVMQRRGVELDASLEQRYRDIFSSRSST